MPKTALLAAVLMQAIAPAALAAERQHVLPESPRLLVREQPPAPVITASRCSMCTARAFPPPCQ